MKLSETKTILRFIPVAINFVSSVPMIFNSLMLYLGFRPSSKTIHTPQECKHASPVTLNWLPEETLEKMTGFCKCD